MATLRVGLKQVTNSCNSPSLGVLQAKKDKSDGKSKATPVITSVHDKENRGTQAAVVVGSSSAQTDISTIKEAPPIAATDLLCEQPSSSYWRGMAEKFEKDIDKELENSFNMSLELDKSYEELENSKNRLKALMEVLDDILDEEEENDANDPSHAEL
ncbi:hypothetical protein RB195_010542 [Necator americanus]|uniref:Geminin n=1 Tax=Necator americanus TaxID=51031 RepID=A0ABR1CYF1_NECAM